MTISSLLAGIALAAAPAKPEAPPIVTGVQFLAVDMRDAAATPVATTRIVHRPGSSCYRWAVTVRPEPRAIAVREVFELPAAAEQWNTDPLGVTAVTADRRSAVTEIGESLDDGVITHGWCVAEGDPVGAHRIRVYVGDALLHQFEFEVVPETY